MRSFVRPVLTCPELNLHLSISLRSLSALWAGLT